mmetsp:Transcript_68573/g.161203  ORF Transcript_68573/g.161203 Transcript_68573/m.161203 type:complete len:171 (+) Transcript_68573:77-589(+)
MGQTHTTPAKPEFPGFLPTWDLGSFEAWLLEQDFTGMNLDDCFHLALLNGKLPGEACNIDRMISKFSKRYVECHSEGGLEQFADRDAVFVLCFSLLMLQTDLHNPRIRDKMSRENYTRNLRGANGGGDFDFAFVSRLYDSILRYPLGSLNRPIVEPTPAVLTKSAASVRA